MISRGLLPVLRPDPSSPPGLLPEEISSETSSGLILAGTLLSPSESRYRVANGYLDLLEGRTGAGNPANLSNFLPGAGRLYEPLWRSRSLTLLTGESFPNEREIELILRLLGRPRGGRYLDLGCSAGLYARNLALKTGGEVAALDISPPMLKETARRARSEGAQLSLVRADAHHLPFADASFSGAACGGTLNELRDPARALREAARVLAPGGRLALMGLLRARSSTGSALQGLLATSGLRFFTPEEVEQMLRSAGLSPDALEAYGPVFFAGASR
ncbi:2-methoxy-6-polyprenyl-1,4-benzoquinol methylase, mitochondrial [Rubrobacter xylanophilus DSM 9941]|uniref:class I SAM-dependent methyltransferase n=1 Tax=Rubrobacter xylanophilus TaxID=49319 RepID=UPI001C642248|nr:class I SAM-dependent methyltransferase [Rubrobacter xylanophilus]QYJ17171.1 2-methoxy-6-polyprenyl-1,4-benzoquinol methylase, mitochondrial [Rubrobacter xylanophilus DSM 9941]